MLTSGISAEYGRFTGGVVNAITKSGGNSFSGSGRINFLNPTWTTETPFEECVDTDVVTCSAPTDHLDKLSKTYEGTFGGPIVRDRLWFFTSGRYAVHRTARRRCSRPASVVPTTDTNKRGEIKITGTVVNNHTIQGGYLNDPRKRTNNSGLQSFIIDPHSEVDRENPNWYSYANYRGVLGSNVLVEAQYSERRFQFKGDGGTSTDLTDSPFLSPDRARASTTRPYFDATDPEDREQQADHRRTSRTSGAAAGRHETKYGYEFFRSQRTGGNSQSSTALRVQRRLPDRRRRHACARFHRPSDSGLRAGRVVCRVLPGDARRDDEHRQPLLLRAGPLGDQRPLVGRSRRAVRARECRLEPGRHHEHRRRPHRASSRCRRTTSAATATTSCTSRTGSIPAGTTKR